MKSKKIMYSFVYQQESALWNIWGRSTLEEAVQDRTEFRSRGIPCGAIRKLPYPED